MQHPEVRSDATCGSCCSRRGFVYSAAHCSPRLHGALMAFPILFLFRSGRGQAGAPLVFSARYNPESLTASKIKCLTLPGRSIVLEYPGTQLTIRELLLSMQRGVVMAGPGYVSF